MMYSQDSVRLCLTQSTLVGRKPDLFLWVRPYAFFVVHKLRRVGGGQTSPTHHALMTVRAVGCNNTPVAERSCK